MLTVKFKRFGFTIEGHAHYANRGEDIVCAGVSALAQAVAHQLDSYSDTIIHQNSGYLDVQFTKNNRESKVLMDLLIHGITEIARAHPENVKIL
jgi:uncharacterized protein YsxB (DUF464 family)